MTPSVIEGIVIGGVGGTFAGLAVWVIEYVRTKCVECLHRERVHTWLHENTSDTVGNEYRSTHAIASWNNLTEDRVRFICSVDPRIYLSTGPKEDRWSIYKRDD